MDCCPPAWAASELQNRSRARNSAHCLRRAHQVSGAHAGVDMPNRREFVAHNLDEQQVCDVLGADGLLYQTVEDLLATGYELNPEIEKFDASCFTCEYVTGGVDDEYLEQLESAGRGKKRTVSGKKEVAVEASAAAV